MLMMARCLTPVSLHRLPRVFIPGGAKPCGTTTKKSRLLQTPRGYSSRFGRMTGEWLRRYRDVLCPNGTTAMMNGDERKCQGELSNDKARAQPNLLRRVDIPFRLWALVISPSAWLG